MACKQGAQVALTLHTWSQGACEPSVCQVHAHRLVKTVSPGDQPVTSGLRQASTRYRLNPRGDGVHQSVGEHLNRQRAHTHLSCVRVIVYQLSWGFRGSAHC